MSVDVVLAYAADPAVRRQGSSGGAYRAILAHLLQRAQIDGAVIAHTGAGRFRPECFLARKPEDVLRPETTSVYHPTSPVRSILATAPHGRYAATLLPCYAAWLKLMQEADRLRQISVKLGLLCNHVPVPAWSEKILDGLHISERDVASLSYRGGGWPGRVSVTDTQGVQVTTSSVEAWARGEPLTRKCAACRWTVPLGCDLAAGDPWCLPRDGIGDGKTVLAVLTEQGQEILDDAQAARALVVEPVDRGAWTRLITLLAQQREARHP